MIEVKNLTFSYRENAIVLDDIGFEAEYGKCVAILGNNGAGKSTLIKCINKINTPKAGFVYVDQKNILTQTPREIARQVGYVPQHNEPQRLTVFDAVLMGRKPYMNWKADTDDLHIVESVLKLLDLAPYALRYMDELSGGELQKIVIARALTQRPKVLLLDEPTSSLDLRNQIQVLRLMRKITQKQNMVSLLIIHDLNLALRFCNAFLLLKDGHIFAHGGMEIMTKENIEAVYGLPVELKIVDGIPVVIPQEPEDE